MKPPGLAAGPVEAPRQAGVPAKRPGMPPASPLEEDPKGPEEPERRQAGHASEPWGGYRQAAWGPLREGWSHPGSYLAATCPLADSWWVSSSDSCWASSRERRMPTWLSSLPAER